MWMICLLKLYNSVDVSRPLPSELLLDKHLTMEFVSTARKSHLIGHWEDRKVSLLRDVAC